MRTVLLASMRRHTRRYVAAAVAVIIGVAFIVTTNAISSAARNGIVAGLEAPYAATDVVVSGVDGVQAQELLDLAAEEGADASLIGSAWLPVAKDGRVLTDRASIGAIPDDPALRWQELRSGRFPDGTGEAVVDANRAKSTGVRVGDQIRIGSGGTTLDVTVVGTVESPSMIATAAVFLTPADLSGWLETAWIDSIAWGDERSTGDQIAFLESRVPEATVQRGDEFVDDQQRLLNNDVDVIAMALLLFAGIALFVSIMVIANTFSILFAQRLRDFALLRCVGATRRQVLRSIRLEALGIGVVASLLGLLIGTGLGYGLVALIGSLAPNVRIGTVTPSPLWYAAAFLVGVAVTLLASWLPTRRAVRVDPLAALRPDTGVDTRSRAGLLRVGSGAALAVAGVAMLALAIAEGQAPVMMAGGATTFAAVMLLGPVVVPAAVRGVGLLAGRTGPAGRLAVGNAVRNPRRTAATTASLLVGVTLTAAVLTGLASSRAAIAVDMDSSYPLDATVTAAADPFDGAVLTRIRQIPGVATAVAVPGGVGALDQAGETLDDLAVLAPGPEAAAGVRGSGHDFASPGPDEIFLPYDLADGLLVGDRATVTLGGAGRELTVRVGDGWGNAAVVAPQTLAELSRPQTRAVWVRAEPGADADELSGDLGAVASPVGGETSGGLGNRQYVDLQLDILTGAVAGLLGIAVIIALVGIGNTLGLSVLERGRESSLLRALGLTRAQLRATLAWEGALLAGVASVIGVLLGVAYAWVGVRTMVEPVVDAAPLVLPWGQLALIVLVAGVAGLLASVLPSRRAARVTPAAGLALE